MKLNTILTEEMIKEFYERLKPKSLEYHMNKIMEMYENYGVINMQPDKKHWYSKRIKKSKAKIIHKCDNCKYDIKKNELYYRIVEIWHPTKKNNEKEYNNMKVCIDCFDFMKDN